MQIKVIWVSLFILISPALYAMERPNGLRHRRPSRLQQCINIICEKPLKKIAVIGAVSLSSLGIWKSIQIICENSQEEYEQQICLSSIKKDLVLVAGIKGTLVLATFLPLCCAGSAQVIQDCYHECTRAYED